MSDWNRWTDKVEGVGEAQWAIDQWARRTDIVTSEIEVKQDWYVFAGEVRHPLNLFTVSVLWREK